LVSPKKIEDGMSAPVFHPKMPVKPLLDNLFDQLPTDMIYYEIFPYLDYESRVRANFLLPRKDRLSIPLRKNAVSQFQLMLGNARMRSLLRKQREATNKTTRARLTLKIWRMMPLFPSLYQQNARFREVVAAKAVELSDPTFSGLDNVSAHTRKALKGICQAFLLSLETSHPYLGEMDLDFRGDDWSAVGKC